jgi:hypothetical protein
VSFVENIPKLSEIKCPSYLIEIKTSMQNNLCIKQIILNKLLTWFGIMNAVIRFMKNS